MSSSLPELEGLRVLIVEDEAPFRRFAGSYLAEHGLAVAQAGSGQEALELYETHRPEVVLLDLELPDLHGIEVLQRMTAARPSRVVVLTSHSDAATAVRALKAGASDYLTKPIHLDALLRAVEQVAAQKLELHQPEEGTRVVARPAPPERPTIQDELLWGEDPSWLRVLECLERVVGAEVAALVIQGESGTGKSSLARTYHAVGNRSAGPFVVVDCPSVPEALFEAELFGHPGSPGAVERAGGGTLLLEELGDLPASLQPALAKMVETRRYRRAGELEDLPLEASLVVTTSRPLATLVSEGRLRRDLSERLQELVIELPPLRSRGQDAVKLASRFAARVAQGAGRAAPELAECARERLVGYDFPGNVRELRQRVQRAVLFADGGPLTATALGLPTGEGEGGDLLQPVELERVLNAVEAIYVEQAQSRASSQREAARLLGIDRFALARRRTRIAREGGAESAVEILGEAPGWLIKLLRQRPRELPVDGLDLLELRRQLERQAIERALAATKGNRARAATLVGMSRTSLGRRLE